MASPRASCPRGKKRSAASRVAGGVRLAGLDTKVQLLWPCKDGQVSVTFLFGVSMGPFTRNLMTWICEEGFCDEATRDKNWIDYGTMLYDGRAPEALPLAALLVVSLGLLWVSAGVFERRREEFAETV